MNALDEIIALKGMCIFGTPDHMGASDEVKTAFREGSAMAYNECADLAEEFKKQLADKQ